MKFTAAAILLALAAPAAWAQSIISARSGVIHYTEGMVLLDDKTLEMEFGVFPAMAVGQVISTEDGFAEVLLAPGSFLRIGPDTAVRMVNNRIAETRLEVLSGRAMVEIDELADDAELHVSVGDQHVNLLKRGLYEVDADLNRIRVYDGKAKTEVAGELEDLKKGRMVAFDADPEVEKFKTKDRSNLYHWSENRSQLLAAANLGSASAVRNGMLASNSWVWNSYMNMFTFLPVSGTYRSPFGWYWYSPRTVWIVTAPRPVNSGGWDAGSSWSGLSAPRAASGGGGGSVSAPAAPRSSAPAAAPAVSAGGGRSR